MSVIEGTRYNQHPKWHFNDEVFDTIDWGLEPAESLTALYQARARRIRGTHDYVILLFSGGIDSTTTLRAFLDQGLPVDEIVTTWSVQAAETYYGSYHDRSPENYLSEWIYCVKPMLDQVARLYPKIKITVTDSTHDICCDTYLEEDFFLFDSYHNLPGMNRWSSLIKQLRKNASQYANHCVLLGLDKPHFRTNGDDFYLYFLDASIFLKSSPDLNVEYFFWDPDAIAIIKKQSHIIFRYFDEHPEQRHMLNCRNDDFLAMLNRLIYPHYNSLVFQANKQDGVIYNNQQKWAWQLTQYQDGSYVDRWTSHWKNFLLEIDPKYIRYKNNAFDGLVGFISRDYHIGKFKL